MAYLIALYFSAVISIYTVVGINQSISSIRMAQILTDVNQAFHMAESGVAVAVTEFLTGGEDGIINFDLTEGLGTVAWSLDDDGITACVSGQSCQRTIQLAGNSVFITVDDIRASEPTITASGSAENFTQTVEAVIVRPVQQYFLWPLYGTDEVWVKGESGQGGIIDSYDSRLGAYGAALDPPDTGAGGYGTLNQSDPTGIQNTAYNADIRTESVEPNMLTLGAGAIIYGDAVVGVGGVPSVVINVPDPSQIKGVMDSAKSSMTLRAVTLPSGSPSGVPYTVSSDATVDLNSCNCSSITVENGATLTLTGDGELHLTNMTVAADSTLLINGDQVTLVVDSLLNKKDSSIISNASKLEIYGTGVGTVDFRKSNVQNNSSAPASMRLFLKGTNTLTIKKGINFYGIIYAPEATVSIDKGAAVFGSVVAKRIVIGKNAAIHYDDALEEVEDRNTDPVVFRSWRQP